MRYFTPHQQRFHGKSSFTFLTLLLVMQKKKCRDNYQNLRRGLMDPISFPLTQKYNSQYLFRKSLTIIVHSVLLLILCVPDFLTGCLFHCTVRVKLGGCVAITGRVGKLSNFLFALLPKLSCFWRVPTFLLLREMAAG